MIKNYKGLKVRQKAYQVCIKTYKITRGFPREERYGLTSQIMRAAVLVPSNIAEGYGRKTTQEYIQALFIAYGSNCELETQILLLGDLGYIKSLENKHLNPWTLFSNFFGEEPELFLPEFFQIRCWLSTAGGCMVIEFLKTQKENDCRISIVSKTIQAMVSSLRGCAPPRELG